MARWLGGPCLASLLAIIGIGGCQPTSRAGADAADSGDGSDTPSSSIVPVGVHESASHPLYRQSVTEVFGPGSTRDSALRASYGSTLAHFGEPGFESFADSADTDAVWFVWLRTFHRPIAVRAMRRGASYSLIGVELDGAGGYEWGKVLRRDSTAIDAALWRSLISPLRSSRFWRTTPTEMVMLDGATWTVAASSGGRLYVTRRQSPTESGPDAPVWSFGLAMLRAAKLARDPIY